MQYEKKEANLDLQIVSYMPLSGIEPKRLSESKIGQTRLDDLYILDEVDGKF